MARHTDESKLIAVKKAAMQIVLEQGVSGASISEIAKKSNVSAGYLYRFYKGKRELLESLFEERIQRNYELLLDNMGKHDKVTDLIVAFINQLFADASEDIVSTCFYHKLLNDYSFEIPEKSREEIKELCARIVLLGKENGDVRECITVEQFFSIVVGGTLQFITLRFRSVFSDNPLSKEDVEQAIQTILQGLK